MKRASFQLFAFAAALSAAAPACAAPALTRLPAEFRGSDVFLQVAVNGGQPVWMKLDIDRTNSALSPAAAKNLDLDASRASLRIGDAGFSNVALRTEATPAALGPDGKPAAGVLASDVLGDRPLWIDTIHKRVWLSAPVPLGDTPLRTVLQPARYADASH